MSSTPIGDRLKLADALAAAECIRRLWGLDEHCAELVGSARRQAISVGDLEFVAAMPADGARDELFEQMDATMQTGGLFGEGTVPVARPLKGFKQGFGYCDTVVDLTRQETGQAISVRVQIHRYDADGSNRGWITLMRTGPAEFSEWFLTTWKIRQRIPPEQRGSVDGHLVLNTGERVRTEDEEECFDACGLPYVAPDRRDAFAEAARARARRFATR